MKHLFLSVLLIFTSITYSTAQVKNVEYSAPFKEPEEPLVDLMQLPNGNTFLITMGLGKEISVTIYNSERKIISRKKIENDLINKKTMKEYYYEGLYEIAGEPVLFIQFTIKRTPVLYRIRFDRNNGRVIEQKKIGELLKYKLTSGYAMAFGGVKNPDFSIYKDPNSDAYAQINFNSFAKETDKRIEVIHYQVKDGQHIAVNRSYYDVADFKYVDQLGLCMNKDNIYITTYAYNTAASGGKDSRVIISKLNKNDSTFTHKEIEFTDDFKDTHASMLFNEGSGLIQLMTSTNTETKGGTHYYMVLISYIDPESLQIVKTVQLPVDGLNACVQRTLGSKESFDGLPSQMILLGDNTTAILLQEETTTTTTTQHTSSTYTRLGKIGVIQLDYNGQEMNSYCINKAQSEYGKYFSYDFIYTNSKMFVIYNDNCENSDIEDPKHYKVTAYVSSSVAIYYQLQNGNMERNFLFEPNMKDVNTKFVNISSGVFSKKNNTYAAIMVDKKGRRKTAHIAWVTFE